MEGTTDPEVVLSVSIGIAEGERRAQPVESLGPVDRYAERDAASTEDGVAVFSVAVLVDVVAAVSSRAPASTSAIVRRERAGALGATAAACAHATAGNAAALHG